MTTLSRLTFRQRCRLHDRLLTKGQIVRNRGFEFHHPVRVRLAAIRERAFLACMSA